MISLIVTLVILGLVLYLVNLLPIDGTIKQIIWVITIVVIIALVLQALFGLDLGIVRLRG